MTQAFNLSQLANNLNTSGQLDATDGLTGAVPVANGGTGSATLTANNVLLGNGTSAVQLVAPSTSGNVLTSNGTTWISSIPSGGSVNVQTFTASGTWTKPSTGTMVAVLCLGGGGGGGRSADDNTGGVGGLGSNACFAIFNKADLASTVSVTVGGGGGGGGYSSAGGTGGNTSFGALIRSAGGTGGTSWDGGTLRSGASPTVASFSPITVYGGSGNGTRNTDSGFLSLTTGMSGTAGGLTIGFTGGTQNIFGAGGASNSASGTGNGSGGAGGGTASGNGGSGTGGLCRIIVW